MKEKELIGLERQPFFTFAGIWQLKPEGDKNSLYRQVKRWIKKGTLIQLKRGLYTTREYFLRVSDMTGYSEMIANAMYPQSYLSSFYVLNNFSMLTESPQIISSATIRPSRIFQNQLGGFSYKKIEARLYTGFYQKYYGNFPIYIATKAKALFDYLWERLGNLSPVDPNMVEELRINWEQMEEKDWAEFKKYCVLANKKMQKMFAVIKRYDQFYL